MLEQGSANMVRSRFRASRRPLGTMPFLRPSSMSLERWTEIQSEISSVFQPSAGNRYLSPKWRARIRRNEVSVCYSSILNPRQPQNPPNPPNGFILN